MDVPVNVKIFMVTTIYYLRTSGGPTMEGPGQNRAVNCVENGPCS